MNNATNPITNSSPRNISSKDTASCINRYYLKNETTDIPIHLLFELQATHTPDKIAIEFEEKRLTYAELNQRANQVARYLQERGVKPEVLVGICLNRSIDLVITLLGVLKAGGAYVPLDPAYPQERLGFILEDAQISILLTQSHLSDSLPQHKALVVCLDSSQADITKQCQQNPVTSTTTENLAYVIYTSGSTGRPKGVAIEHRNTAALIRWANAIYTAADLTGVLAATSICFDLSVFELFVTLCLGGKVILAENALQLPQLAADVTLINTVPSAISALLRMNAIPASVRVVNLAGEPLQNRLVQGLYQIPTIDRIYNLYGPSEDTTYSTFALIERGSSAQPEIGIPIAGTQVYVFDAQLQPVPIGTEGELYIGGEGLARGYLNRDELTAARFIVNPFGEELFSVADNQAISIMSVPSLLTRNTYGSDRLYQTGDLVRMNTDGSLEFLGRIDRQVKIRGFRIELGEIEVALAEHPAVQDALVAARKVVSSDQQLVAYVVPKQSLEPESSLIKELRAHLIQKLPHYMVPSSFMLLSKLPLTPNGKIDRLTLPAPERAQSWQSNFVPPRTAKEQALAAIWIEVLGCDRIGINDNFWEIGGHSLLATQVLSRIFDTFQVKLSLRCLFELPTIVACAAHLQTVAVTAQTGKLDCIQPQARTQSLPLSCLQQQLWFLNQLVPNHPFYNVPEAVRWQGALNIKILEKCLQALVQRHEALRTTFATEAGKLIQVIGPELEVRLSVADFRSVLDSETAVEKALQIEAQRPFDLRRSPLIRATLFCVSDTNHILLLNLHHIICDEWSFKVLFEELLVLYTAFTHNRPISLPKLTLQYADFAVWQQQCLERETSAQQIAYWKKQLKDASSLQLPTDRPRSPSPSYYGARHFLSLPEELTRQLKELSQREGVTLFMTLLATFQTLLYRYTGQTDICIGSPSANRHHSEVESVVGFFVNTLVLRTDLSGNPSFQELLSRVRDVALDAYTHSELPFEKLVEALQPAHRDRSYNPLFQVMFNLQNVPMSLSLDGVTLERLQIDNKTAKFDLSLDLIETPTGIQGFLEYSTDLFEPETVARTGKHWQTLLAGIVANPAQRLSYLPLLTAAEHQQFAAWNQTDVWYSKHLCVHQMFEAQVEQTPDAVAIIFGDRQLAYSELNERSNQLAHHLQTLGVKPETLVGICAERSLEMAVGLLAILKAGGAYVPLDPAYPQERLSFMLEDSQVAVLLTQTHLAEILPAHNVQVVYLDRPIAPTANSQECLQNPHSSVGQNNLAYIIYTSGSTGRPKGVAIEHRSPVTLIHWARSVFSPSQLAGVLASTSICFDLSVFELFVTLSSGGKVIVAKNALCLPHLSAANQVTLLNTVPSAITELLRVRGVPASVLTVNLAGEPLSNQLVQQIYQHTSVQHVYNLYGPSEDTTYSTYALIEPGVEEIPAIGCPIYNTQAYVLDAQKHRVPVNVPGELYLGGAGLARGYLNQPELTAETFVPSPFAAEQAVPHPKTSVPRLYKTGDLVRYRPDGKLEFLGRLDCQVKIRGFRIELGEIESVLTQYPTVTEAVVIARAAQSSEKRLVAYVVSSHSGFSISELRRFLKLQLPEYMVPAVFVVLDKLPLNPNGKVDRSMLPKPEGERPNLDAAFVAPKKPAEIQMAQIWTTILKLERVGICDNFFELGGNSLLAAQLMVKIRDIFHAEMPIRCLFETPTIKNLVQSLESLRRGVPVFSHTIDLQAEATLDPDIYPRETGTDLSIVRNPNHIFLTGATGFLGAFVLYELLQRTQASVHCLVRAANAGAGLQRIQQNLEKYGLWHPDFSSRIYAIPGDLGQPLLGLTPREFERLAAQIDVIYHNGAPVNFVKPYSAVKAETVLGTQETLRLAIVNKVKPFHFISTVAVFGTIGYFTGLKMLYETDDLSMGKDYVHMGYTRSKWVAEKLVWAAQSRKLPITILRPGLVLGHSKTGITKTDDYPSRLIKGCIQIGSFPDLSDQKEELIPVDYASQAIAHLTTQPESIGKVFHLVPQPGNNVTLTQLFNMIRSYGYSLKQLPYSEWKEELLKHSQAEENALYPLLPFITDLVSQEQLTVMELYQNTPDYDSHNTTTGLANTNIICPPINQQLIETCFSYFINSGFFKAPN
ncbi:amino acid adenylation domain-containing protein [Microcoleus sp. Pol7_A1]|uniref:amino acid adenylation domain-containing protein n=1 Tax=Microcoleus sp. Pol7_A1 TaxID=2818893 RepID=UPI002FD6B597